MFSSTRNLIAAFSNLEIRNSQSHASINRDGHFQRDLTGIEAEVKDGASALGTWTFYGFPLTAGKPASAGKPFPRTASCYACHRTNTAVENTFVQFYPVLYDVAEQKGTLNPGFAKLPPTAGQVLEEIRREGWAAARARLADTLRGSPEAAVTILEQTASKYPASAEAQDLLADAYLAAGDREGCRRASDKAVALLNEDRAIGAEAKARLVRNVKTRLEQLR
jgi:hypothetical protein